MALAPLIAGTCWVVASSLSPWLVPPYLLLMALFLAPPAGHRAGGASDDPLVDASTLSNGRGRAADGQGWTSQGSASGATSTSVGASGGGPGTATIASTTSAKGGRGKGRSRKAKAAPELPEATWIEVGPGKFVRAEASAPAAEVGPHVFVEGRPEAADWTPNTPSEGDDPPWGGPADASGPGEVPRGVSAGPGAEAGPDPGSTVAFLPEGEGPEASRKLEANPESAPLALDEGPSTADGIEPQVAGPFAVEVRAGPEVGSDDAEARDRADRTLQGPEVDPFDATVPAEFSEVAGPSPFLIEGSVPADLHLLGVAEVRASPPGPTAAGPLVDEPGSGAEAVFIDGAGASQGWDQAEVIRRVASVEEGSPFEPGSSAEPGRLEVRAEADDPPRWESEGWADSPERLASEPFESEDEPNSDLRLERLELAEADDFDRPDASPDEDDPPVASDGPSWWPRPWSKAHRTRPGFRALATPAAMPPRHLGRSRAATRPPADPRRPSRRGLARPRQGSRTFPPRSPPRDGRHGGR